MTLFENHILILNRCLFIRCLQSRTQHSRYLSTGGDSPPLNMSGFMSQWFSSWGLHDKSD